MTKEIKIVAKASKQLQTQINKELQDENNEGEKALAESLKERTRDNSTSSPPS